MKTSKWSTIDMETSLLGFGCMRLPLNNDGKINEELAERLLDKAYKAGINYFDTAYVYHNGESEVFLGKWMKKHERENIHITTKLPMMMIKSLKQAKAIFEEQLDRLGTDYLDCYLLHGLNQTFFQTAKELGIIEYTESLKREGRIKALGFSFHDNYDTLAEIINYRDWDLCQIQLNYMDTEIQSGLRGYQLAGQKKLPLIIMEPLRGGALANLPEDMAATLKKLDPKASPASWAFRWFADLKDVSVILSGMSTMEQLEENMFTFKQLRPLNAKEKKALETIKQQIKKQVRNGCTDCRYCMPCPGGVNIPQNFTFWNDYGMYKDADQVKRRWLTFIPEDQKAKNCINCGKCEEVCPQKISIRSDLAALQKELDALCR